MSIQNLGRIHAFASLVENLIGNDRRRNAAEEKFSPVKSNSSWSLLSHRSPRSPFMQRPTRTQLKKVRLGGNFARNWQQRGAASNTHRKETEETWRGRLRPNQLFTALDPTWESGRERLARCGMEIFHLINVNREVTQRSAPRLQRRRATLQQTQNPRLND